MVGLVIMCRRRCISRWAGCDGGFGVADLAVNLRLAGYAARFQEIMNDLQGVQVDADAAAGMVDGFYDGAAKPRLQMFYASYAADVGKLSFFYSAAEQFVWQIIDDFGKADQDLVDVLLALAKGG